VNAIILFATSWPDPVKYALFAFGCSIFVFIWFFLQQRRKNVSRDAVELEKKMATESASKLSNTKKARNAAKEIGLELDGTQNSKKNTKQKVRKK
jgi:hypothetical protein